MGEKPKTLETLLQHNVFTPGPHDRWRQGLSTPFLLLSEPKFNTTLFPERAWQDTVALLKEIYPAGRKGHFFILDGLIDDWHFFYTKHEFRRLPQEHAPPEKGAATHDFDVLTSKLDQARRYLQQIPHNVELHYFYGPTDMANMVECYNGKIDDLAKQVEGIRRAIQKVDTVVQRMDTFADNSEAEETKKYETLETDHKHRLSKTEAAYSQKAQDKKTLTLRQKTLGRATRPETRQRLEEEVRTLASTLKSADAARQAQLDVEEQRYALKREDLQKTLAAKRDKRLQEHITQLQNYQALIHENLAHLSALHSSFRVSSVKAMVDDFTKLSTNLDALLHLAAQYKEGTLTTTVFQTQLEQADTALFTDLETVMKKYHVSDKHTTMHKRNIAHEVRVQLVQAIKEDYKKTIEDLLSPDGKTRKIIVHPYRQDFFSIPGTDGPITILATGFPGESDRSPNNFMSVLKQKAQEASARLGGPAAEEDLEALLGGFLGVPPQLPTAPPDFYIGAHDYIFRIGAANFSHERLEPTYMITLGPFFDVTKARALWDYGHVKSAETRKANKTGATSGLVLVDYNRLSPRFTPFTLDAIRLEDKTLNSLHTSDAHEGKEDQRRDLNRAIAWIKEKDETLESHDETGDVFQSLNYPGSATEGSNRLVRIDDQVTSYFGIHHRGNKAIIARSRLKNPIRMVKGNHDKPLDPLGVNMTKLAAFFLNLSYMDAMGLDPAFISKAYKLKELGEKTFLDDLPIIQDTVGHEAYLEAELLTKDGTSYGTVVDTHKVSLAAPGDKMDPISKTVAWLRNCPVLNQRENPVRLLNQGHMHIWQIGMAYNGVYICTAPPLEAMDKEVSKPYKTYSSFGLMVGFSKSVPGATKQYLPQAGAITFEFLHEATLGNIYHEYIEPHIEELKKAFPTKQFDKAI